jgi:hypothetical protein
MKRKNRNTMKMRWTSTDGEAALWSIYKVAGLFTMGAKVYLFVLFPPTIGGVFLSRAFCLSSCSICTFIDLGKVHPPDMRFVLLLFFLHFALFSVQKRVRAIFG